MKVEVIYASRTGCTAKVAQAIYDGISGCEKSIHDLKDGVPALDGDILLLGYWGMAGGPDPETREFLTTIRGKAVGVFCTLGYYGDSAHAFDTLETGRKLLETDNEIIGGFVCNGAVASHLIRGQGMEPEEAPREQKQLRWEMVASHPTAAECALASERFRERINLYTRCRELGIPFTSIR